MNRKLKSKFIKSFILSMFLSSLLIGQNQIFVDKYNPMASDENLGFENEPLYTIAKAVEIANPGDTIIVGEGRYDERVRLRKGGTESAYITLKGKNIPVISSPDKSNAFLKNSGETTSLSGIDVNADFIVVKNLEITRIATRRGGINIAEGNNLVIKNNFIHELECTANNWGGVRGVGNNIEISNNVFWRVEGAAIMLEGSNSIIANNNISHGSNMRFSDGLYIGGACDAIRIHGINHQIKNNTIHDFLETERSGTTSIAAIRSYTYNTTNHYLHDILIQNNVINNMAENAIYIMDSKESIDWDPIYNITISNNIFNGIGSTAVDIMDAAGVYFINNTVAYCKQGLQLRSGSDRGACDNSVVLNNIFYQCVELSTYNEEKEENSIWDYNLHYPNIDESEIEIGYEEHSLFGMDPMFIDSENLNFNLHEYSIAVDAGIDASNYIEAFDINNEPRVKGNSWDIGAIESPYTGIPNSAPLVKISNVNPMVPGTNESVNISIKIIDNENNSAKVIVDWGDGTVTNWSELVPSNSIASFSHQYITEGKYYVKAKAIDERLWESEWTENYPILVMNGSNETDLRVEPSLNVEVGEEVFFDATGYAELKGFYNSPEDMRDLQVTWDFGNGYNLAPGFPKSNEYSSGVACTHFFMKPGAYVVTMVMAKNGQIDSAKAIMKVTGEAPIEGFELWHANFEARIAQYIYAQIPEWIADDPSNQLVVSIIGNNGQSNTLINISALEQEEKFLLRNADLPAGSYVLQAEIKKSTGERISIIREKFDKPYNGAPKVGYNENNALVVDGQLFYPVSPWQLNWDNLPEWGNRYINTTRAIGYYSDHSKNSWQDYLDKSWASDCYAIGPERYEGKAWGRGNEYWNQYRNTDVRKIEEYIEEFKNHPAQLFWFWQDEVNLGGSIDEVPVQVNSAWSYLSHKHDPQRPHWSQYFGLDYTLYHNGRNDSYNYLYNEEYFGGKKHFTSDMISHDIYPYDGFPGPSLEYDGKGPIYNWVEALEQLKSRNYNLVAAYQSIESQDIFENEGPAITDTQLRMIIWLAVAHEIKGINWFQYFAETPPENFNVMAEFLELTTNLALVILGPKSEIVINDNANIPGNRIDLMAKETDEEIYLFAVRLTEPDIASYLVDEPETIDVQFSINNATGNLQYAEDYSNIHQRTTEYINVEESKREFIIKTRHKIVPGTLLLGGKRTDDHHEWMRVYDDSLGNLHGNLFGTISSGTVNYETGEISITFGHDLTVGNDNIRVCYKPILDEKLIPISGGNFSDTFSREEVKIYRIPKNGVFPNFVTLNVESEFGNVTVDPEKDYYQKGAEVTLTVEADSGYQFVKWNGDIESSENPITVKIDSNMTIGVQYKEVLLVNSVVNIDFDNNIINKAENDLAPVWYNGEGTFASGISGEAIVLDGTSDGSYVRIKRDEELENFTNVIISVDAKKQELSRGGILFVKHVCYSLAVEGSNITGYIFTDGNRVNISANNVETINDTGWHNYKLNYDNEKISLFVDDSLVAENTANGPLFRSTTIWQDLYIGKYPWGNCFNGLIDNFSIAVPYKLAKNKNVESKLNIPTEFALEQNYPNPFNPVTTINYAVPKNALVKISVYNLLGQEVAVLVNEYKKIGHYNVNFNAANLTSGMYIYTISADSFRETKKMMLIK